jgi:hypothetical protein
MQSLTKYSYVSYYKFVVLNPSQTTGETMKLIQEIAAILLLAGTIGVPWFVMISLILRHPPD